MALTVSEHNVLRYSLVCVWLATALASALENVGQSAALLARAGIADAQIQQLLIWSGSALDLILGLALWLLPGRLTYSLCLIAMLVLTVVASGLLPSLWFHPLGPLTKNIPIAAILYVLIRDPE